MNISSVLREIGFSYFSQCYSAESGPKISIDPKLLLCAHDYYFAAENACNAAGDQDIRLRQLCITNLHSLWLFGTKFGLVLSAEAQKEKISAEHRCWKWLNIAKRVVGVERNDLAALETQQSIMGKQFFRSSIASEALYRDA